MQALLQFLKTYEAFIYLFLGAAFLLYLLKTSAALRERQSATFDLERERAEAKIRGGVLGMGLTFLMAVMVFSLVTYVAPSHAAIILPTATVDLLATPGTGVPTEAATPIGTPTPLPTPALDTGGCKPGQVEITSPKSNDTLQGEVNIEGTALIPNFGFYKVDIAPISQALFLTIYASHTPVKEGKLVEKWDTSTLPPGDYVLQLVVVDNTGKALPPCRLKIHIAKPKQEKR